MEWSFDTSAEALPETEERAARSHHVLTTTLQTYGLCTDGPEEVLRARYEGLQVGRQHAALATTLVRIGATIGCAGPPRSARYVGSLGRGEKGQVGWSGVAGSVIRSNAAIVLGLWQELDTDF